MDERAGEREVRTATDTYRLRAGIVGGDLLAPGKAVLVVLEPRSPRPLADGVLKERFGLSPREIRVARLLAWGKSNQEIARELVISAYTARRHTEHVLQKLGVASRAQVGRIIFSG